MSNKSKIFIDGREGTTGLRIFDRISAREDIELIVLSEELRKDSAARREALNASDISFLCLPDVASIEAVSMIENTHTKIIDTSTAHRTNAEWTYGFPEMGAMQAAAITKSTRVANPGCYATGFISIVKPLIELGFLAPDSYVTAHALSGYSGAGKKAIAQYDDENRASDLSSPRHYALGLTHKHIPEMMAMTGLARAPIFSPMICDYYCGMTVTVPLFCDMLGGASVSTIRAAFEKFYAGQKFIRVASESEPSDGFLASNVMGGRDSLEIFVSGNDNQIVISSRFDNLGKGASGAAIQCMNLMLGCDPSLGLDL